MKIEDLSPNSLVLLLDADSISYSITHQLKDSDNVADADKVITDYMQQLYREVSCSHACVFLGGVGNFRYEVAKTKPYKGQRKELDERAKLWKQYITAYLVDLWDAQKVDGIEADDALSITAVQLRVLGINYLICSNDKDLDTVWGNHYSMNKRQFYHISEQQASLLLHTQYITGDTADNIPGLPGKGKVYAQKLLGDKTMDKYTEYVIWAYYTHLPNNEESTSNYISYFQEQKTLLTMLTAHDSFVPLFHSIDVLEPALEDFGL